MGKNNLKFFIAIFISGAFLFGCGVLGKACKMISPMTKDVMEDRADEVDEVIIAESDGTRYLVIKEKIFQATSKSDNHGIRTVTGYDEYRISSYDLATGKLVKRIELGEREEGYTLFLGETKGKLWYKSINKEIGLHARDPKTLEIIVSQEKIINENPFLKGNLSEPEWNQMMRFYGFDFYEGKVMVTDNKGFVYYLDPESLKAEKTTESIKDFDYDNTPTTGSVYLDDRNSISLTGNPREHIRFSSIEDKNITFLHGDFLVSSNMLDVREINPDFAAYSSGEIKELERANDSLSNLIKTADTLKDRYVKYYLDNYERTIKYNNDRIEREKKSFEKKMKDDWYGIITPDKGVIILSQSDATDQAKVILSKVIINPDTTFTLAWETPLNDIYRDPDKGFDKSSFEEVFSSGDPELNQMRVAYEDGRVIFIYQLKATCIEAASGKVLWSIDL